MVFFERERTLDTAALPRGSFESLYPSRQAVSLQLSRPANPAGVDPAMMIADETPFGNLIVLKKSGEEGGMCEMKENVLLIGRDPEKCDIQIRLPEVSKMQARLTADEYRQVWIENLSQTNPLGTLLNDERCDGQPHLLANKDIITICGRRFRFEYCIVDMMRTVMIPAFAKAPAAAAAEPKSAIAAVAPLEVARGAALTAKDKQLFDGIEGVLQAHVGRRPPSKIN